MQKKSMTAKEVMVLASELDATTFYGLCDPFRGMSRAEIRAAIPELQHQAEQRGLATIGFDLSFHVKAEAADLISICAMCDRYMMIEAVVMGDRRPKTVLYGRDGNSVLLQTGSELIELKRTMAASVRSALMDTYFPLLEKDKSKCESVKLPISLLRSWKETEDCDIEKLTKQGCPEEIAEFILQGLQEKCTYLSVIRVDLQDNDFDALLCLISPTGRVRLQVENVEGEELCCVSWLGSEALAEGMDRLFRGF